MIIKIGRIIISGHESPRVRAAHPKTKVLGFILSVVETSFEQERLLLWIYKIREKGKYLLFLTHTVEARLDLFAESNEDQKFLDAKMVLQLTSEYFYNKLIGI